MLNYNSITKITIYMYVCTHTHTRTRAWATRKHRIHVGLYTRAYTHVHSVVPVSFDLVAEFWQARAET